MDQPRIIVERNIEATMRDGVILRANLFRPEGNQRLPVLLLRTPYNKDAGGSDICLEAARRGYAAVVQDTRGRYASEGMHLPFHVEIEDGHDTVEWAASQPWANGKVGMWGSSYGGWTQWAAAALRPPSLKALFPGLTFADIYEDIAYPGGALALGVALSWNLSSGVPQSIARSSLTDEEKERLQEELYDALDSLSSGAIFGSVPLSDAPLVGRPGLSPGFADLLEHPRRQDWEPINIRARMGQLDVPALHIGGWYDLFSHGTIANYCAMREGATTEEARASQRLIVGPWLHGPLGNKIGEVDMGLRASDASIGSTELMFRWFDYWLKGEDNGVLDGPPVRIFVMGRNIWRDESEWPLARTAYTPCYLHSGGSANSLSGDGSLTWEAPAEEPPDRYDYDPRQPVPTRGGGLCCWEASLPAGAYDQRPIEERNDVLVYTSAELEEDLEVTGPIRVVLWAASSAIDTDWTAKLVDVGPCGYARNLTDGILRVGNRDGTACTKPLTPGVAEQFVIELPPVSNVFLAGHRIRLEVSSSNFPKFDRNPNTGRPVASEAEMLIASQTILHDAQHPSHILLPVIPA